MGVLHAGADATFDLTGVVYPGVVASASGADGAVIPAGVDEFCLDDEVDPTGVDAIFALDATFALDFVPASVSDPAAADETFASNGVLNPAVDATDVLGPTGVSDPAVNAPVGMGAAFDSDDLLDPAADATFAPDSSLGGVAIPGGAKAQGLVPGDELW